MRDGSRSPGAIGAGLRPNKLLLYRAISCCSSCAAQRRRQRTGRSCHQRQRVVRAQRHLLHLV